MLNRQRGSKKAKLQSKSALESARKTRTTSTVRKTTPPQFLALGYHTVEVVLVSDLGEGPRGVVGLFEADHMAILIQDGQGIVQEANTLLHEVIHAVHYMYGLEEKNSEERIATVVANGLMEIMARNPELVKYFNIAWRKTNGNRPHHRK